MTMRSYRGWLGSCICPSASAAAIISHQSKTTRRTCQRIIHCLNKQHYTLIMSLRPYTETAVLQIDLLKSTHRYYGRNFSTSNQSVTGKILARNNPWAWGSNAQLFLDIDIVSFGSDILQQRQLDKINRKLGQQARNPRIGIQCRNAGN